jgi:hypothetical protein
VRDAQALLSAQRSLRSRFEDFRRAFDRRDGEAYRVALADFHSSLQRWTAAIEAALLPAVLRAGVPGRDPRRELRLDGVQVRELTRFLVEEINRRAPLADLLGLVENLARRFAAHDAELLGVYFPAASPHLTPEEWSLLEDAAPRD